MEIAIKSSFFICFTWKLDKILILPKDLRKCNEKYFFGNFGASAGEINIFTDANESYSSGALLRRV